MIKTGIKTKGVVHFTIPVSDIERSERFYVDLLGMEVVSRVPPAGMVFLQSGKDIFVLARSDTPVNPNTGDGRMVHHGFLVDQDKYDEALALLRAGGVNVIHEEFREQGVFPGRQVYFHDPDRNVLELLDRPRVPS